jgi:hypothetical protein
MTGLYYTHDILVADLRPNTRKRLDLLAAYMESLPRDYNDFGMRDFFRADDDRRGKVEARYARKNGGVGYCGAVACAVGHGPSAGIFVPKEYITFVVNEKGKKDYDVDWAGYSRLFTDAGADLFDWLFSSSWVEVDNHHWGAAARIRYILDGNEVPEDFEDEPTKKHKKLYAKYDKRKIGRLLEA